MRPGRHPARHAVHGIALAALLAGMPALADPIALGRTLAGHPTIDLAIDENGPYTFVFDTGASHSAIALPVARNLGFDGAIAVSDDVQALTTLFEADLFTLENVSVAGLPVRDIHSVVLPADDGPLPVQGFFAPGDISANRYHIDFYAGTLELDGPELDHADGILHEELGLLFGTARMGSRSADIRVLIDTGTARSFVNNALNRRLTPRSFAVTLRVAGVDNSDTTEGLPVRLRRLNIGGLCLRRVDVVHADLDIFDALGWNDQPAIVVGMDILESARLTVDRESGRFELNARRSAHACRGERTQLRTLPPIDLD